MWLENVDQTHLVLASGKLVLQNKPRVKANTNVIEKYIPQQGKGFSAATNMLVTKIEGQATTQNVD